MLLANLYLAQKKVSVWENVDWYTWRRPCCFSPQVSRPGSVLMFWLSLWLPVVYIDIFKRLSDLQGYKGEYCLLNQPKCYVAFSCRWNLILLGNLTYLLLTYEYCIVFLRKYFMLIQVWYRLYRVPIMLQFLVFM